MPAWVFLVHLSLVSCAGGDEKVVNVTASPVLAPTATRVFAATARAVTGDSLDAFLPARTAVTYIGLEAPPGNTPCGQSATARHQELVREGVFLEKEASFKLNTHGLRLFHAFTPAGESVGLILIRAGLARATDVRHRLAQAYADAEAEARAANRGCLWDTS